MARRTLTESSNIKYIDDYSATSATLGTLSTNSATPSVALGRFFTTGNTVATTITDFGDAIGDGHHIVIYINDVYTTIAHDATKIDMPGGMGQTFLVGDILEILSISGVWKLWNSRTD